MASCIKLKVTLLAFLMVLMFQAGAFALTGTYVVLIKGGGGLALTFSEKGTFTSVAINSKKRKHYGKGKYTVSGDQLTLTTSTGVTGIMTIEPDGHLYDKQTNFRFHRYHRRR